ncbi:hypothetical protein OAA57_00540 [bacterium]|jgi:hypothetical protein|nr:hypothetical protein [bacterium]MDB4350049.1 hypothetical protein [bacterium]
MNIIEISGGKKKERILAERVAEWTISKLMPRMRTLDIDIKFVNFTDKVDGYCLCVSLREFQIELQKGLDDPDMITALIHELVHVKQHARKELIDNGMIKKWKGEEYLHIFTTVDQYMSLPWEEEAYRLQEELYEEWKTTSV